MARLSARAARCWAAYENASEVNQLMLEFFSS
jgi:hypothetical protein